MADTTLAYQRLIRDAELAREGRGANLGLAAQLYDSASMIAPNEEMRIRAIEQCGVTNRLLGRFAAAGGTFTAARHAAEEAGLNTLVFGIQRNQSMLFVDMAEQAKSPKQRLRLLSDARREAQLSYNGFWVFSQLPQNKEVAVKLMNEAFCSLGFLGRIIALRGDVEAGRCIMGEAHLWLHGKHDIYERNNLVWLMRFTPPILRLRYLPRALKLTRGSARLIEVLLIALSSQLYQFIKSRHKRA